MKIKPLILITRYNSSIIYCVLNKFSCIKFLLGLICLRVLSPVGLLRKQDFYGKKFTKILNHLHVIQTFEATIHHNIITLVNPIYIIYCCFMQKKTTTIN